MPEFLIILLVVGVFLGVFFLVSIVREKRELTRDEPEEKPQDRKAA
jgi:F0F1-type ATP synthase assembly protein I